jgi:hypothetical protein
MGMMQTYTGRIVDPLCPQPDDIDIKDIAHSLSLQCRYNGHCKVFYSVAQHSVYVASLLPANKPRLQLKGLLHDASEAFIGDITRPVKMEFPAFKEYESIIQHHIYSTLCGVPTPEEEELIQYIDNVVLSTEAHSPLLFDRMEFNWGIPEPSTVIRILPKPAYKAEERFLEVYSKLAVVRGQ